MGVGTEHFILAAHSYHTTFMAKQSGDFPLIGSFGDFVFYKTKHGNLVRRKGNLNKERVTTEAAFEGSRKASTEFGRAGAASGLLRNAVKPHCPYAGDGETHARLSKVMGAVIREDKVNPTGERQVLAENIAPLKAFEWVADHPLSRSFWAQCGGSMSPEGLLTITLPGFTPKRNLAWPAGATHAQVTAVGMSLNFPDKQGESASAKTGYLMKSAVSIDVKLECAVSLLESGMMMVGIGVEFFEESGGRMTALREGAAFGLVG